MKNKLYPILNAAVAAFTLIGIQTFLHPCRSEMPMGCVRTAHAASGVLAAAVLWSILLLVFRKKAGTVALTVLNGLTGAALFFVPLLGHCGGAEMACNLRTIPAIRISALVIVLLAVIFGIAGALKQKGTANA